MQTRQGGQLVDLNWYVYFWADDEKWEAGEWAGEGRVLEMEKGLLQDRREWLDLERHKS